MAHARLEIGASLGFGAWTLELNPMTLDLTSLTRSILATVFNLGGDVVKNVSYVRPVSLTKETGETAVNEIIVATQAVIGAPPQGSAPTRVSDHERLLIRATDINAIATPAAGDYIVQTSNNFRRDVISASLDPTGQVWSFLTVHSLHQDFGDLTAHGASDDWSDLIAATEVEDRGALYE
jgi:hypothetical protein